MGRKGTSDRSGTLALTAAHLARVARIVPDPGPPPGTRALTDQDYAQMAQPLLDQHRQQGGPFRLFAYGSLIWKPEVAHEAECPATAHGWHRSFCLRISRFRGSPEQPGLMMALDRGGQCRGMLYDLPQGSAEEQLDRVLRRECSVKPTSNLPRWLRVTTERGTVPALGFVINRRSPYYVGRLDLPEVAAVLSHACGHWGSGAEYLLNTVSGLAARGIHDGQLWMLQRLVAEAIDRAA